MKRKGLCILLTLCLLAGFWFQPGPAAAVDVSVWDGTAATDFAGGRGTQEKPYLIETAAQLAYLAQSVNSGTISSNQYFSLEADLNLSRLPWTPIGTKEHLFYGTFSGNAHTISNLYINAPSADYQGLFGLATYSEVQNLCLTDISVTGNEYVGGIVGRNSNYKDTTSSGGIIRDCNVSGSVTGNKCVGGACGHGGTFSRCINQAKVFANSGYAGGIAGYGESNLCINHGEVDTYGSCAGGIAGCGNTRNCMNTGSIGGNAADYVGGIAGNYSGYVIRNSCNMGQVKSNGEAAGISLTSASNCYNVGDVSSTSASADVYSVSDDTVASQYR